MVQRDLPFGRSTAARLMRIAGHEALCAHVQHLPPSWGTLAVLSRLPGEEVERLVGNREIHPAMERMEAERLVEVIRIKLATPPLSDLPMFGGPLAAVPPEHPKPVEAAPPPPPPPPPDPRDDLRELINQVVESNLIRWLNELPLAQRIEFIEFLSAEIGLRGERMAS